MIGENMVNTCYECQSTENIKICSEYTAICHECYNRQAEEARYYKSMRQKDPEIDYVRNGDLVRLEHVITRRNIHSHNQPAPVMKRLFQVETYHQQVSVCLCF